MAAETQPKFEKVMIIDDNYIDLYIINRLIIKNNFAKEVLPYEAAAEAIKYLQDNQENFSLLPQIIFTDIYMLGMSGFEFLDAYDSLNVALKKYCKVFIISSTIDDKDIERSLLDKNSTAFQVKPITKEFLDGILTT